MILPAVPGSWVLLPNLLQFKLVTHTQLAFITGFGIYLVMHLLLWKPVFIHVMGHELTHALWAVILGGKIKSLLVSREGGQVTLSKTNFFIALAPYFFPIYTFLILPIYLITASKFHSIPAFLIGFTLALHLALTLHSLHDRQSDIWEIGLFFSMAFIYLMNLIVIVIIISVISPEVITLPELVRESGGLIMAWLLKMMAGLG
ncbi:hypothetical protein KAR10_06450 [bacterium]|nr:hypothetical protein [bacterium]